MSKENGINFSQLKAEVKWWVDSKARLANISSVEGPVKVRNNEFIVTYRYMLSFGFSVVIAMCMPGIFYNYKNFEFVFSTNIDY